MTFQEALAKERRWHKRVFLINLFHHKMILKHGKWTQRQTSKKLRVSLGAVSEAIKLAKALIENADLEMMDRDEALARIRK